MKPLDIVEIDTGAIGIVKEGNKHSCSILWFGKKEYKGAWWREGEKGLKVIDNIASILVESMRHPSSSSKNNPYNVLELKDNKQNEST